MFRFIVLFFLSVLVAEAHVGSPAVVYDGMAGPYSVRVIILPPAVVPGRAEINVRLLQTPSEAVKVTVLPVNSNAGLAGAPPADEATAVTGEPDLRHGELWLMNAGSYSVHVTVSGARGQGTVVVPVIAAATRVLAMSTTLKVVLAMLGGILFWSAATLVGAGVRESVLPVGASADRSQQRNGRFAVAVAAVVIAAMLYGGKRWWDAVDSDYRNNEIYRASPLDATVSTAGQKRVLHLTVSNAGTYGVDRLQLIPDHGKIMHLFMVREPQLDVMAHLHPVRSGDRSFTVTLPALPDGDYQVYSDITYETGFAATLTSPVKLARADETKTAPGRAPESDSDDSWSGTDLAPDHAEVQLAPRGGKNFRKGQDVNLEFAAIDAEKRAVSIEPYMGMMGHAMVLKRDGSVFAHLHPIGTISMAAEEFFTQQRAQALGQKPMMDHSMHQHHSDPSGVVAFPYVFPQAGSYRIWAQVKVNGMVVTGVSDVQVE